MRHHDAAPERAARLLIDRTPGPGSRLGRLSPSRQPEVPVVWSRPRRGLRRGRSPVRGGNRPGAAAGPCRCRRSARSSGGVTSAAARGRCGSPSGSLAGSRARAAAVRTPGTGRWRSGSSQGSGWRAKPCVPSPPVRSPIASSESGEGAGRSRVEIARYSARRPSFHTSGATRPSITRSLPASAPSSRASDVGVWTTTGPVP